MSAVMDRLAAAAVAVDRLDAEIAALPVEQRLPALCMVYRLKPELGQVIAPLAGMVAAPIASGPYAGVPLGLVAAAEQCGERALASIAVSPWQAGEEAKQFARAVQSVAQQNAERHAGGHSENCAKARKRS